MDTKISTNQIEFKIDKDALNKKYKLFSITSNNSKGVVSHLCNDGVTSKFKSCYFENKFKMYVLTTEDITSLFVFNNNINIEHEDIFIADDVLLLNLILFLNTHINSVTDEPISNIDGRYFLFMPISKKDSEIITLDLRFKRNRDDSNVYLSSELKTFAKYNQFTKEEVNKKGLYAKPRYKLNSFNLLTRTSDEASDDVYIERKKSKKTKNSITECIFNNDAFKNCRVNSYCIVYKLLHPNVNEFIETLKFVDMPFMQIGKEFAQNNPPQLINHKIKIVNTTEDNASAEKIQKEINKLSIPEIESIGMQDYETLKTTKDENTRYVIIINNNEKESDIYHHNPDIVKQCIVAKNANKCNNNIIYNILFQLQIKADLKNRKIAISQTPNTESLLNISAVTVEYERISDKYEPASFSYIRINSNGEIIDIMYDKDFCELKKANKQLYDYCESTPQESIANFMIIDDDVFEIASTGYKTIPNINYLHRRITNDGCFDETVKYYINLIKEKVYGPIKKKEIWHKQGLIEISELFDNENKIIDTKTFIDILKNGTEYTKKYANKLIAYFDNEEIYHYEKFRKAGTTLKKVFSCYDKSGYQMIDDLMYYIIQSTNPENPIDKTVENANLVYYIKNINKVPITEEQKNIFLWMLCVTFVKFKCYSTKPFLFKYLDEMENIEKEKEY